MVRYIQHQEIDKAKWDACIDDALFSILYGYSWYLDIISPGWDGLVDGDYETVFPLTWKKKYGLCYLTQPNYAQQLGIFSTEILSTEKISSFLSSIPKKFLLYDLYMNPGNACPDYSKYFYRLRKTYHLPLNASYDQIFQKYSNDTKRNLKKLSKRKLIIKPITVEEIIELYKKNVWHKTPGIKLRDYQTLSKLSPEVGSRKKCLVTGVFENDVLCAGALFFIDSSKIIFIFGSANSSGRKNGAMRFIFDRVIQTHCNRNLVLDFEGSSINTVEYFYKSFGSDKITFTNIQYSKIKILKSIISVKQKISKLIAREKIKSYRRRQEVREAVRKGGLFSPA